MVSEVIGQCPGLIDQSLKTVNKFDILFTVSEQIVHLRTPRETTVGKVMASCIKMLGVTEDKSLFIMTETRGSKTAGRSARHRPWTQQRV